MKTDDFANYYEILELDESASNDEVRVAYRILSLLYHPDKITSTDTRVKDKGAEKFRTITEAYDVLKNPEKRQRYDELLKALREQAKQQSAPNHWNQPPPPPPRPAPGPSPAYSQPPPPHQPQSTASAFWHSLAGYTARVIPLGRLAWHSLTGHAAKIIPLARLAWKLKRRQIIATLMFAFAVGIVYGAVSLHKSLLAKTTISFSLSVDGKDIPVIPGGAVTVDEKPFTSGSKITLGRHRISVQFPGVEPFERNVWMFYGKTDLGSLPLESSKGSLSVMVKPSPAQVIVQHEGKIVQQGDAPFKVDKLQVGDYSLIIRRGEYEESHSVTIERQRQTEAKIDLALGSAKLSSSPPDTEFELSGNGRHWQGKLPIRIDDVPVNTYQLITRRGEYEESSSVKIERQQQTEARIELKLGSVSLSSDPADAEFDLLGNGRHWHGKLPLRIDDVPIGNYSFLTRRKGWELSSDILVSRGDITTNKTEFQYGSISVTSDPTDLAISTNGMEIGKTPTVLHELKPGQYTLTATDGENEQTAKIMIGPKEETKHAFIFHYGIVQLSSTPTGAIVIRKGKDIGKTPLTIDRIPAGETIVELRLQDYSPAEFPIRVVEGVVTKLSAKLISERYIQAMKQARAVLDANQFEQARKFVEIAIQSDPTDSNASALLTDITQKAEKWRLQQLEAERLAAEEKVKQLAAESATSSITSFVAGFKTEVEKTLLSESGQNCASLIRKAEDFYTKVSFWKTSSQEEKKIIAQECERVSGLLGKMNEKLSETIADMQTSVENRKNDIANERRNRDPFYGVDPLIAKETLVKKDERVLGDLQQTNVKIQRVQKKLLEQRDNQAKAD